MTERPWLGLALSLAVHASVILLVLAVITPDDTLPALIVDLRDAFVSGAASIKSEPRQERPARAPRSKEARSNKGRTDVAPVPAPPTAPSPPIVAEAPPAPPTPVPAPAAPAVVPPTPEPAPGPSAPLVLSSPREVTDGRLAGSVGAAPGGDTTAPAGGAEVTLGGAGRGAPGPEAGTAQRPDRGGPPGQRVAAVSPGGAGSGVGAEYGPYLAALRQRIQQSVRYPASARRRGLSGTVSVEILIQPNGAIGDVALLESSSHPVLDEAALDTIRSLPRVPLPPDLPARALRVRVPVVFQMR